MKKVFLILLLSIFCLGDDLNDYLKSKPYLNSLTQFDSFVTGNTESIIGSNLITISLVNKNREKVSFKILKDQPIIITDCDFKIFKKGENFSFSIDSDCNSFLSPTAQNKYVLDIIKSSEQKINFIYNKGDL